MAPSADHPNGAAPPRKSVLTVAMTTCQGERYLGEQLASVLEQDRLPDAMVIGDDASTDDTRAQLRAFAEAAPFPVTVQHGERRRGVVPNLADVLAACEGDLVVLADQDDVWHPGKLRALEAAFVDESVLLAFSDARLIGAEHATQGGSLWSALGVTAQQLADPLSLLALLLSRNVVTGATAACRASLVAAALPFPPGQNHDHWLALVAAASGRVAVVAEPLMDYRLHAANVAGLKGVSTREVLAAAGQVGTRVAWLDALALAAQESALARPDVVEALMKQVHYARARAALPASRPRRVPEVVKLWRAGDYHAYGRGLVTALVDLASSAERRASTPVPRAGWEAARAGSEARP